MAAPARIRFIVLAAAAAALAPQGLVHGQTPDVPTPSASRPQADGVTLQPGDILQISVWPDQTLGGQFPVEETGNVYLPFLGSVHVVGLTLDRLRSQLREGYGEVMKEPVVTITPLFRVGVMGAVRAPGNYTIDATQNLLDVINQAGGFSTQANQTKVRIVRTGEVLQFNVQQALEHGADLDALTLRSGDNIVVPNKSTISVQAVIGFLTLGLTTALLIDNVISSN